MKQIQIAIDGPASSGKSTVAKIIAKDLGYTQKKWEKTFYFHPWILSFEESPPNLRYVADYVNDEFTVYFAKKHGRWRAYWDAECQNVIEES